MAALPHSNTTFVVYFELYPNPRPKFPGTAAVFPNTTEKYKAIILR
jgi:hypothetical protein